MTAAGATLLLRRLRAMASGFGITRIADITGLDRLGIPVAMVCRPNARALSVSQGKGRSFELAAISGLMESIESWHAEAELEPVSVRCPSAVPHGRSLAPDAWPDQPIAWLRGWEILADREALVPRDLVSIDTRWPRLPHQPVASTNGLAAGASHARARLHALSELIERDALTLWEQRSPMAKAASRIDLRTVDHPVLRPLLDLLAEAGILVAVWDCAGDIDLPTWLVHLMPAEPEAQLPDGWEYGSASRLDSADALEAAILEACQARLTQIAGSRDDVGRSRYAEVAPEQLARHRTVMRRVGGKPFPPVAAGVVCRDPDRAFESIIGRLAACGVHRLYEVDLTRPEIGIPVVKLIAPQLEDGIELPGWRAGARARHAAGE